MKRISNKSSIATLITAALVAISGSLIAAPSASAAKADLVWYIDRTYREVIDIKGDGDNTGDITVTNGTISEIRGGEPVGTYATSQITAAVAIPGGRQSRQTMLAFEIGKNTIYTTSLVTANAGTPPRQEVHPRHHRWHRRILRSPRRGSSSPTERHPIQGQLVLRRLTKIRTTTTTPGVAGPIRLALAVDEDDRGPLPVLCLCHDRSNLVGVRRGSGHGPETSNDRVQVE